MGVGYRLHAASDGLVDKRGVVLVAEVLAGVGAARHRPQHQPGGHIRVPYGRQVGHPGAGRSTGQVGGAQVQPSQQGCQVVCPDQLFGLGPEPDVTGSGIAAIP